MFGLGGGFGVRVDAELPVQQPQLLALAKWLPEILAFHRCGRVSNGRLEGQMNKLGMLKRIAYGFVNADNFAARALLWCPPMALSEPIEWGSSHRIAGSQE